MRLLGNRPPPATILHTKQGSNQVIAEAPPTLSCVPTVERMAASVALDLGTALRNWKTMASLWNSMLG
jgi:hypothetical protein